MPNILRFSATNDGWKHSVRKGFDWAKQHLALSLPLQQKVEPGCFLMDDPAPGPNCDSIHSKEEAVFSHLGFFESVQTRLSTSGAASSPPSNSMKCSRSSTAESARAHTHTHQIQQPVTTEDVVACVSTM